MQKKFIAACAAALLLVSGVVHAQGQLGNGVGTFADKDQNDPVRAMMPQFLNATYEAFEADARLLGAVGLVDQAALASARAKELEYESTIVRIEQIMTARSAAAQVLATTLATGELHLEASAVKQQFGAGIDSLANAIQVYDTLCNSLPTLKKQLRELGPNGRNTRSALFIAKSLPQYKHDVKQELHAALVFARANGILYAPIADVLDTQ